MPIKIQLANGEIIKMALSNNLQLVCPIRGQLTINKKSKDGLTATEESFRVEAIRYLISKGYPKDNFW